MIGQLRNLQQDAWDWGLPEFIRRLGLPQETTIDKAMAEHKFLAFQQIASELTSLKDAELETLCCKPEDK